ncbi:MAG: hypothetical protein ABSE76_00690 [Minisyncoccia bacterium]|jgi:hypothetical protein
MDIEQKKDCALSILSTLYQIDGKEEIFVSEGTLLENELGEWDFWNIICPLLAKEEILKEYSDPDTALADIGFDRFYNGHPLYKKLNDQKLQLFRSAELSPSTYYKNLPPVTSRTAYEEKVIKEIERLDTEMEAVKPKIRGEYRHRFVVDGVKLFLNFRSTTPQHIVIDDTPEDTSWHSLQLRFTDGRTLHASIPAKKWAKNSIECEQLGLEKKGGRPKEQWHILEEAASHSGQIKLASSMNEKESKKKQINLLKTRLKAAFPKLKGEPLEPVGRDAYHTTFEILPEQQEERRYQE